MKFTKHLAFFSMLILLPEIAMAGGSSHTEIFKKSCGYLTQIQTWIFGAAYVLGAIGLVIIAVSAFLGRFKFSHLISLGGGLFIVAMADFLLAFITNGGGSTKSCVDPGAGG